MEQLQIWFATSPLASFLRTFLAGVLGWIIINANDLNLHPAVAIALASSLPVLVSWLNPADERFGTDLGVDE
jgi:hypothetical protein